MSITTTHITDYVYNARNDYGHAARIDMREGDKEHLGPMEMVLSALSGCVAVEVALMIKKRRKTLEAMEIHAEGDRREKPPRSYTAIRLHFVVTSPDAEVNELEKIVTLSLQKYCSVADSLKADITTSCEIRRALIDKE